MPEPNTKSNVPSAKSIASAFCTDSRTLAMPRAQSPHCLRRPPLSKYRCPRHAPPRPTAQSHCRHARSHTRAPPRPSPAPPAASRSDQSKASARHSISSAPRDRPRRPQTARHETPAPARSDPRPLTRPSKCNPTPCTAWAISRAAKSHSPRIQIAPGNPHVFGGWGTRAPEHFQRATPKKCSTQRSQKIFYPAPLPGGRIIAPMTRARTASSGVGRPRRDPAFAGRGADAVREPRARRRDNARDDLQPLLFVIGTRTTAHEALPQATSGISSQGTNPHPRSHSRPCAENLCWPIAGTQHRSPRINNRDSRHKAENDSVDLAAPAEWKRTPWSASPRRRGSRPARSADLHRPVRSALTRAARTPALILRFVEGRAATRLKGSRSRRHELMQAQPTPPPRGRDRARLPEAPHAPHLARDRTDAIDRLRQRLDLAMHVARARMQQHGRRAHDPHMPLPENEIAALQIRELRIRLDAAARASAPACRYRAAEKSRSPAARPAPAPSNRSPHSRARPTDKATPTNFCATPTKSVSVSSSGETCRANTQPDPSTAHEISGRLLQRHPRIHRGRPHRPALHVRLLVDEGPQHPHPMRRIPARRLQRRQPHPPDIVIEPELDISPLAIPLETRAPVRRTAPGSPVRPIHPATLRNAAEPAATRMRSPLPDTAFGVSRGSVDQRSGGMRAGVTLRWPAGPAARLRVRQLQLRRRLSWASARSHEITRSPSPASAASPRAVLCTRTLRRSLSSGTRVARPRPSSASSARLTAGFPSCKASARPRTVCGPGSSETRKRMAACLTFRSGPSARTVSARTSLSKARADARSMTAPFSRPHGETRSFFMLGGKRNEAITAYRFFNIAQTARKSACRSPGRTSISSGPPRPDIEMRPARRVHKSLEEQAPP